MADSVIRNEYGEVVYVQQPSAPMPERAAARATPQQVADWYLRSMSGELGLAGSRLADDARSGPEAAGETPVVQFSGEKDVAGDNVVVYKQSVMGLDIFEARLGMQIDARTLAVESVQSSMHSSVTVENPQAKKPGDRHEVSKTALKKLLGFDLPRLDSGRIERQVVYRYEPDARQEAHEPEGGCIGPAPEVPRLRATTREGLAKGKHYIVDEVLFQAALAYDHGVVNWRMLVEPESGDVLYLRALVACATGLVFDRDPQTQSNGAVNGGSTNAALNPFRTSHALAGLTTAAPQPLTGTYVTVTERQAPVAAPPTVPNPVGAFDFDVRTDFFSAVNAYHHCDRMFRTMEDYGFDVANYFDGTTFPVPVDHRALGDGVNAEAPGTAAGNGLLELRFGRLMPGQTVGMATCNRVAWHEFGHALLWDHVDSPNFGFAHSAGDALAAVLNDPGSQAPDRFETFPWVKAGLPGLQRRHDRAVAAGWAWFGANWNTQYGGEQVLSTTLFRFYRSIGGDAADVDTRRRAAQTTAYLTFKAIGLMVATTPFPEVYVGHLQTADLTTADFKGIAGGALHKVIRWAFEKQGLFQPNARPGMGNAVNTEGNPPDVDVYIDDGRNGEYTYQPNHWSCQDMWVRRAADGGTTHQEPLVGLTNFMYVRVKNRGLQAANNVRVDAYHALPGTGLAFPDDWAAMTTPSLPAAGALAPGASTVVGPFAFVPTEVGHECLLAIVHADGDAGCDTTLTGTIPEHRLVPFDNNIGQRNVSPVYPSLRDLMRLLREHVVWVRNPFRRPVAARIELALPRFLRDLGWQLGVRSEGGSKFELGPRDRRKVLLALEPDEDFDPETVRNAIARGDNEVALRVYLDGELSGGMSYRLSFEAERGEAAPVAGPAREAVAGRRSTIEEVLGILRGDGLVAGNRTIRTVRIEFDLEDDA